GWRARGGDGVAGVAYGRSEVRTVVKGDVPVTIIEETEYPFRDEVRLTVNPERAAEFALNLRIPAWANQASIAVNGGKVAGVKAGAFHPLNRTWQKAHRVPLH